MVDDTKKRLQSDRRTFLRAIAAGGLVVGTPAVDTVGAESTGGRELVQVTGGEGDLGRETDDGHYYYDPSISGEFDVSVHCRDIEHTHDWAKAGIMVRESLESDAPHLMVRRIPEEGPTESYGLAQIQWRPDYGDLAEIRINSMRQVGIRAEWLRLKRVGDNFEIYGSMTGSDWEQFGEFTTAEVNLSDDVLVGLAVTSGEYDWTGLCTATFKDLSGFSPSENVDLGDATPEGDVTVRDDVPIVDTEQPEISSTSVLFKGILSLPSEYQSSECYFQYREAIEKGWETTSSRAITESGLFSVDVSLPSRRIYEFRAVADVPDAPEIPEATPMQGTSLFINTPSRADCRTGNGELSSGMSHLDLDDGFTPVAPWLDDDTPVIEITEPTRDSLYEAFRTRGERLIVFETSGVIDLEGEDLSIRTDNCYVAGQTAPSPGITFIDGGLQIAADGCVLQHIRCRPGDYQREPGWAPTSIQVQDERENNIVDHCTTTWGIDENLTIGGETTNTTYSNNLIAEALRDSTHPERAHSMGSLINPDATNVALLGNVWAFNENRNPRLRLGSRSVVVNNLSYNYSDGCWMDPQARASIIGNQYLSPRSDQPNVFTESLDYGDGIPKAYLEDNYTDGDVPMIGDDVGQLDEPPLWPDGLDPLPVERVRNHNLANAGARPGDRTPHDVRIIHSITTEAGDLIDSQREVGGYPELAVNTHSLNIPACGTRAWLRSWSKRVETPQRY